MRLTYKKPILLLIIFGAIILLMHYFRVLDYLTISHLQEQSVALAGIVEEHYLFSVVMYSGVYAFLVACALPVVAPLTMLGGYLFGVFHGVIYAAVGASAGATIYFLVIRYIFAHTVRARFAHQLASFHEKMNQYGASYLISLQLLTIIPYFVINTLAALANVPLITFIWTTVLGGLPLHAIYATAGRELATLRSVRDILKPSIIVLLLVMALVAALPVIIRSIQHRRHRV